MFFSWKLKYACKIRFVTFYPAYLGLLLIVLLWSEWLCSPTFRMLTPHPQRDGGRRWGLWAVLRSSGWSPCEWDQCPYRRGPRELCHPFLHVRPARRRPSVNPEASLTRPSSLGPCSCLHSLQNRTHSVCAVYSPPACSGVMLQLPQQTKTDLVSHLARITGPPESSF